MAGFSRRTKIHGPSACSFFRLFEFAGKLDVDTVPCVRCLVWPTQAADWPTRYRNYDWPDSATVDYVVRNGCDMVGVAHVLCREDEWMSKRQWRLSFSRAEVVLLNSWMPVQQTVYHMLRYFLKTEQLINSTNNAGRCMLSNYHIKTVMLWACEVKSLTWWTDGSTVVSLSLQLLQFFDKWLTEMYGRHYFINNVQFFHYLDRCSIDTVAAVVNSTTEDALTRWFVDNYICKCAELCPENMSHLYGDLVTNKNLPDTASRILRWKDHISLKVYAKHVLSLLACVFVDGFRSWEVRPVDWLTTGLKRCLLCVNSVSLANSDYVVNNYMYSFLHLIDSRDERNPFKKEFIYMLSLIGKCHFGDNNRQFQFLPSNIHTVLSALREAAIWMKIVANKHPNNHQPIQIEMAKTYLVTALRCVDSGSDSIYSLANVYLAFLS